jgi:hypothetical protein
MRQGYRMTTRGLVATLAGALALAAAGCGDDATAYENVCPLVSHAGPAWHEADGLHFGVWLVDLEEDPVDLVVERGDGIAVERVYGHGAVGLTSMAAMPGSPHELVVTEADLAGATELQLTPVDLEGCSGEPVVLAVPAR